MASEITVPGKPSKLFSLCGLFLANPTSWQATPTRPHPITRHTSRYHDLSKCPYKIFFNVGNYSMQV